MENLIALVAPHRCLICRQIGTMLCEDCWPEAFIAPPSRCYRCHRATRQSQVCPSCRTRAALKHVWVASEYALTSKKIIHKLKFDRANAAAEVLARAIDETIPNLPPNVLVCHVPTANNRVRIRGYDQSRLIARSLGRRRSWSSHELLWRHGSSRQVGSSREVRLKQLKDMFKPLKPNIIKGAHILLIDDVVTTGATLEEASRVLKGAGAQMVDAAVFTQPVD